MDHRASRGSSAYRPERTLTQFGLEAGHDPIAALRIWETSFIVQLNRRRRGRRRAQIMAMEMAKPLPVLASALSR